MTISFGMLIFAPLQANQKPHYAAKLGSGKVKKLHTEKTTYYLVLSRYKYKLKHEEGWLDCDRLTIYKNPLSASHAIGTVDDYKIKFHNLNSKDINHDGRDDIVLSTYSGGNCFCCEQIEIYNIKNNKMLKLFQRKFGCIKDIVDLNHDGSYELIFLDDRFAGLDHLCRACSPIVYYVYTWKGQGYRRASQKFKSFYEKEIIDLKTKVKAYFIHKRYLRGNDPGDYYLGNVISLLLNYAVMGDKENGIRLYKRYAKPEFFKDDIKPTAIKIYKNPENFLKKCKISP